MVIPSGGSIIACRFMKSSFLANQWVAWAEFLASSFCARVVFEPVFGGQT